MTTSTTAFRRAQTRQFTRVADALRNLDDDDLTTVKLKLMELLKESLDDGESWEDPIPQAFGAISDVATDEINYRLGVIWNAEAAMRGGHRVGVSNDWSESDTFQALCFPEWDDGGGGRTCWEGAPRATFEEAMDDGRRHNPGFEPDDNRTGL